ncbi:MAG: PAC2 family protein, partial [Actinobacteria bacterium]|nr:PAC2 family protein [Actinomycetota bacterium]
AYPASAATLLDSVQRATGLVLPGDALREAARRTDLEIARQVEGSAEVAEVVQALEQQYDAFAANRDNLLGSDEAVPTAEELGAQFERFLAEQQRRGDGTDS